jgi:carbon monoxide dehydrogenase subunit G
MAFHIEHDVHIDRTAAEIGAFLVDLRNQTYWYEGLRSVRLLEGQPGSVGSKFNVVFEAMGRDFRGVNTIAQYEPGSRIVLESDQAAVTVRSTMTFAPEGTGTRVVFAFDVETRGITRLFAGKIRGAMAAGVRSNMESLRRYLEHATAGAPNPVRAAPA